MTPGIEDIAMDRDKIRLRHQQKLGELIPNEKLLLACHENPKKTKYLRN